MQATPLFCRDCKHLKGTHCERKAQELSLVTGEPTGKLLAPGLEREAATGCGERARYFEARDETS